MSIKGKGTVLEIEFEDGTWVQIGEVNTITGPTFGEVATVETTHLLSAARTYISTIGGGGSLGFEFNHDPDNTSHQALVALVQAPANKNFRVTLTDSTPTIYSFNGILKSYDIGGIGTEEKLTGSCEVQISGKITTA